MYTVPLIHRSVLVKDFVCFPQPPVRKGVQVLQRLDQFQWTWRALSHAQMYQPKGGTVFAVHSYVHVYNTFKY